MSNYQLLLNTVCDDVTRLTASQYETLLERAENQGIKLKSLTNWVLKQPISDYTKQRIESIYREFTI